MKFKNLFLIISILFVLTSCFSENENCDAIYFGGQIINPVHTFITLSKNDIILDSIYLDGNNSFFTQLESDEEGLYTFNYGNEFQYVYFEPKDSILIRLNTWDFDESLVFSGRGSEKNNFLITMYLENEKENHTFSPFYNLEVDKFEEKINSTLSVNGFLYKQLKESGVKISPKFDKLAKTAIAYSAYSKKEYYPMVFKNRLQLKEFPTLPKDYYNFRKDIDLNDENLIYYSIYNQYINSYIQATAYQKTENEVDFTLNVLKTIVDNITVEQLKNSLLYRTIYNDFRKSKQACIINKTALSFYNNNCTNPKFLNRVNALVEDCEKINNDSNIDNFTLSNLKYKTTRINEVIKNNNTVIYFWSPIIMSPDMLVKKLNYLEEKYPSLLFVGINMDSSEHSNRINKQLDNQYILPKNSSAHNYISSLEPRTILIDKNGIVFNSFTYLSSYYLEKQLSELEQR